VIALRAVTAAEEASSPASPAEAVLAGRLEAAFLAGAGWDPQSRVLTIDPAHPLLGRSTCKAPGCQTTCPASTGICLDCRRRLEQAGLGPQDAGLLPPPERHRWLDPGAGTCVVASCPRPWVKSSRPLCPEHLSQQELAGIGDPAVFAASPGVKALASRGKAAPPAGTSAGPAVTRASLQADLLAAHERAVRLSARVRQLEKRLSEALGEQAWRESGLGAPPDIDALTARITQAEQEAADLRIQLADRDGELAAARAANRELMTSINHEPKTR
jgi:hypothetical protein